MSTPRSRPLGIPLEDSASPEAVLQQRRAHELRVAAQDNGDQLYLPTVAELTAIPGDFALAVAHGRVLRSVYSMDARGGIVARRAVQPVVYDYYREILSYLCQRQAGILLQAKQVPPRTPSNPVSKLEAPRLLRDAEFVLKYMIRYRVNDDPAFQVGIPHRDYLDLYVANGYISDVPGKQLLPPPEQHKSWAEFASMVCNPSVISVMLDHGVSFDVFPTEVHLNTQRVFHLGRSSVLPVNSGASAHYEPLREMKPGDFLGYFKIFGPNNPNVSWELRPTCVQVVKQIESLRMSGQIELALSGQGASIERDGPPASLKRRIAV